MASRRSLRKQPEGEPQGRRKSLRLASQKVVPLNHQRSVAYQAPTTSVLMDFVTPRTVLKKVLQTQTVVSPLVSEKPDSPKPIGTIFHFPEKTDSSISLEVSLSDLSQRQKSKIARHPTRSKKVRLSVFERDLNNQFHFSTDQGLLDHTSLTKSLQISFTTPAPLKSPEKKGLLRRPKHYQRVNVKDFEGGLEQDLLQIKDAENYPEDQKTTTLQSNNTEAQSVETELFLPPHSSEENDTEPSNALPEPDLARPSFSDRRAPSLSQTRLAREDKISDVEVEKVPESSIPKEILTPVEGETECMEEKDDGSIGRCQESPEEAGKGLKPSQEKEKLSPGTEDASSMENISQERIVTPQSQQQKIFHGNSPDEELSTPQEPLKTGLGARRSSTPTSDAELPEAFQSSFSSWLSRKIVRRSVNELVAHITQELDNLVPAVAGQSLAKVGLEKGFSLREKTVEVSQSPRVVTPKSLERTPFKEMRDRTNPQTGGRNKTGETRNVETEQILDFETEGNPEVEQMSESEDMAVGISQSPRVVTPKSRASGKTPKSLERTPFKEMRDRTNPQTGGRNKRKEMWNVEIEQVLESEAEGSPEAVEMSESENIEPTGNTPAFVRAKAFHCTPLLSSPPVLKEAASGSPVKQDSVQRVPKPAKKACRRKQEPSLPNNLVKKMFIHHVKMPVTKEALEAVERCVNVYFKHLSNDLDAYVTHARRKIAEPADLELLMKRQGLITDKMPLNVLVERHLPFEYRKLLIPIATSGNKVIPQKPK